METQTVVYEVKTVNAVLEYLNSRPYGEVANLIGALANPVKDDTVVETEPAKKKGKA